MIFAGGHRQGEVESRRLGRNLALPARHFADAFCPGL
jgi:hypothetical protein